MKKRLAKVGVLVLLFLSIQINCFAESLENLKIDLDKNITVMNTQWNKVYI